MNTISNLYSLFQRWKLRFFALFALTIITFFLATGICLSAPVTEDEAVAVADFWYTREINLPQLKMKAGERSFRMNAMKDKSVFYLVSKDQLNDKNPGLGKVLAYVVKYKPEGFVVVAGDDRIEPIIAFDVKCEFRWDQPERNFMRSFLGRTLVNRLKNVRQQEAMGLESVVHPNWTSLRSLLKEDKRPDEISLESPEGTVYLLWETAAWDQCGFYNDTVAANNGNDDCVPTGCTATAMAIKMRFHKWPETGNGSHAYSDGGNIAFDHSVNFGEQTYDWSDMPTTNLTQANVHVADLMYHCGVAVDMNYEQDCGCVPNGGSGAWPDAYSMNNYFRHKGTVDRWSNHLVAIKNSILAGLPVVLSSSAHTVVADGYRDTQSPYFHLNCGWGNSNCGWYNLDQIPGSDPTIDKSCPYCQPNNYVYVNKDYTGSQESGIVVKPYDTFAEGYSNCLEEGHLWLKGPKTYLASPTTLTKKMIIHSYEGNASIQP